MLQFKPATRHKLKARVALAGPSGSGKTYTALRLAFGLVGPTGRVAVIDTENRSAEKYVGTVADGVTWAFDVATPTNFDPLDLAATLREAARHYDVIVVDSLTHFWSGEGGMLERVDASAKRSRSGNSFDAWREQKPTERAMLAALTGIGCHLIVTMRTKTEWVIEENEKGRKVPRKLGTKAEQRDGIEYEFDVVGDLDIDHTFIASKTRCPALDGKVFPRPGADVAGILRAWLDDGEAAPQPAPAPAPTLNLDAVRKRCSDVGVDFEDVEREMERIAADWTYADRAEIQRVIVMLSSQDATPPAGGAS